MYKKFGISFELKQVGVYPNLCKIPFPKNPRYGFYKYPRLSELYTFLFDSDPPVTFFQLHSRQTERKFCYE